MKTDMKKVLPGIHALNISKCYDVTFRTKMLP